jgi:hypothetical protein
VRFAGCVLANARVEYCLLAFDRQLSSTLINFELVQFLMRVDESFRYSRGKGPVIIYEEKHFLGQIF